MNASTFGVSPEDIRAYSRMHEIGLTDEGELANMAAQVSQLHESFRELWKIDVSGHEMAIVFPV